MPISSLAIDLGVFLFILLVVAFIGLWLFRRGKDRQALKDTKERLKGEQDARDREKAIQEAAKRVRDTPGPAVPDFLRPGPGSPPESP